MKRENGQGSITQRTDGRWMGRIMLQGKSYSVYGKTQTEVRKKIKEKIQQFHRDEPLNVMRITVNEYVTDWFHRVGGVRLKSSSYDRKEQTINYQINPYIGHIQMGALTHNDVQGWIDRLSIHYSYSTVKKAYEALNAALKDAVKKRSIPRNPAEDVLLPSTKKQNTSRVRCFTDEQIAKISQEATRTHSNGRPVYRLGWGVVLLLNTGLRIGEALALEWTEDVNFDMEILHINKNTTLVRNRAVDAETRYILQNNDGGKTYASNRVVPMNKTARLALEELKKLNGHQKNVFSTQTGSVINPRAFNRMFHNILTRCNIDLCGVHTLRHTFASALFRSGTDIKVVSEILGHSDVSITYNTYIHLVQEQKARAIKLAELG